MQRGARVKGDVAWSASLADGAFRVLLDREPRRGAYERAGRKVVLSYDDASRHALAAEIAARVEASAAAQGQAVEASVEITKSRATAKVRESKRKGRRLKVDERHTFKVTTTGDVAKTRRGVFTAKGTFVGGAPEIARSVSPHEVDVPYIADDPVAFWARTDLYVMQPDVLPLDRWPDEVLFPTAHGVRVVVLLPGDYRGRSNGRLGDGVLYVEDSGTAEEPLLFTYAPAIGADLRDVPHPTERMGTSEARILSIRIWNQSHQVFHGLTFRDDIASSLLHTASDNVIDSCLWHETSFQPLRIRFDSQRNVVQRCVMRRFAKETWGHGDTVAIQLSDGALTHNRVVSNVILNYTDSYQHTDRDGEPYGLGAGTLIDNNVMGFTRDAYVESPDGELMCGENTIDLKMGGTQAEPVVVSNNVFFGVRAADAGCAASGSGGYAVTLHRRGTWVEMTGNLFVDMDSGIFLNSVFLNVDAAEGRIDPHWTFTGNTFSDVTSRATAFPARTGRVLSGLSPATFTDNRIVLCERLMESEPFAGTGALVIANNAFHGPLDVAPRDAARLLLDGNLLDPDADTVETLFHVPWTGLEVTYRVPR